MSMLEQLADYEKDAADNPEWAKATRVHDWRNHVPQHVQEIWHTFTQEQRYALYAWADAHASNEHWD